jgi:drug/metabolite transporter (DMT)-like permease
MVERALSRTIALTAAALLAFAANSVLCRLALRSQVIDPWTFTAVRLASGALILLPLLLRGRSSEGRRLRGVSAAALFGYALAFSLAYLELDAGTGALLLFGSVQVTMIGAGLASGERPSKLRALGMLTAAVGLVVLVAPGVSSPQPLAAASMALAGICWGVYSLRGRGERAPLRATASNFVAAAPAGLLALLAAPGSSSVTAYGVGLAVVSGALTSGLGYVAWYAALPGHSATSASIVQLAVPVIAAGGGVVWLGERPSWRLLGASALTLGGILMALLARRPARAVAEPAASPVSRG